MIIDQKRAHERILYEIYLERLNNNRGTTQTELFPVELELNPADLLLLNEIEDYLKLLGFNFAPAARNCIKVTGYPSEISSGNTLEMIEILLGNYKVTKSDPTTGIKEKIASAMAGAAAIPYGKTLSKMEMEELIDALFACNAPNYSSGGNPVLNILTIEEIDKRLH